MCLSMRLTSCPDVALLWCRYRHTLVAGRVSRFQETSGSASSLFPSPPPSACRPGGHWGSLRATVGPFGVLISLMLLFFITSMISYSHTFLHIRSNLRVQPHWPTPWPLWPPKCNPWCWVPSRESLAPIIASFGGTQLGIESTTFMSSRTLF